MTRGAIGEDVKDLQKALLKLGYDPNGIDGSFGPGCDSAVRRFQRDNGLVVDGSVGPATVKKINELLSGDIKPVVRKSEYFKIGDTHIIKTKPGNIKVGVIGKNLKDADVFGVNGTFYDTNAAPVISPESCVFITMNDGKAIGNNAQFNGWNAPPRATLIYHTSGQLGFRQLKNINPIRNNTVWAVGGYMVKPYMDFKNEKIPASINYRTAHTYLGYDANGYVYMIVKPYHMIRDIVPLLNMLKITNCIVLDGGGSSQLRHPDGSFHQSRQLNTAIMLKEV